MAALFRRKTAGRSGEWYYCLRHRAVEEGPDCPAQDRFGPYPTRTEAEHAMDTARERNEAWRNDPRWNDEDAGEDGNEDGRGTGNGGGDEGRAT